MFKSNQAAELSAMFEKEPKLLTYCLSSALTGRLNDFHKNLVEVAVTYNATDVLKLLLIKKASLDSSALFMLAIKNHAEKSFLFLLEHAKMSDNPNKIKLANHIRHTGNLAMLNALLPEEKYSLFYFDNVLNKINNDKSLDIDILNELTDLISLAYRFSSMQDVSPLCHLLLERIKKDFPNHFAAIEKVTKETQDLYLKSGTQISKYRSQKDLSELSSVYTDKKEVPDYKTFAANDLSFGLSNHKIVEEILKNWQSKEIKKVDTDSLAHLLPLPPGEDYHDSYHINNKSFSSMRTLVKIFSETRFAENDRKEKRFITTSV